MNWKLLNRVWHANLGMAAAITLGLIALSCPFIAHKGDDFAIGKALMDIHYGKFLPAETRWIWIDSQGFLLMFLVVSGLLMHRKSVKKAANVAADDPAVPGSSVTLIDFGTGARGTALATEGEKRGLRLFRCTPSGLDKLVLSQERWLAVMPSDDGYSPTHIQAITSLCHPLKPGSAKRLQFAVAEAPGAADIIASLSAIGARQIKLEQGAFEDALLSHLGAQSDVLKKAVKKTAPTTPITSTKPATAGFTLMETLGSLGVVALLLAGGAGALQRMATEDRVSAAAREFEAMVRDARDLARRENTWVRVALLPSGREQAWLKRGDEKNPRMGTALFVLRRPWLETISVALDAPTASFETAFLQENATSTLTAVPPTLLAGWEPAPGHATWKLWDATVKLQSSLFRNDDSASPWRLRGGEQPDFPAGMDQTPLRNGSVLAIQPLSATDRFATADGHTLSARDAWGSQPVKRWVQTDTEHWQEHVPAFDISPTGELVGADSAATLTFVFRHKDQRRSEAKKVVVQTSTAESWIE